MPLERHELRHRDGRRLLVYGELRGSLDGEPGASFDRGGLHKRFDPLTGAWIAISPARNVRPSTPRPGVAGMSPGEAVAAMSAGDAVAGPPCPLCPGGPEVPFSYEAAVFENRFPSLVADPPPVGDDARLSPSQGRCEVVLYTDRHSGSLATLAPDELARLLAIWRDRSSELWSDDGHRYVMIFENRGEAVGTTLSHPHGQIYAFDHMPPLIATRAEMNKRHRLETGGCLSCAVVAGDHEAPERNVLASAHFMVAVPFAARWPYEVHVRARRHGAARLADLDRAELIALSGALRELVLRYDGLFGFELPYMMAILESPADSPDWHLSVEFLPPLRGAKLTKIRASVETVTGLFVNDTLPEDSAARLAAVAVEPRREAAVIPQVVPVWGQRSH